MKSFSSELFLCHVTSTMVNRYSQGDIVFHCSSFENVYVLVCVCECAALEPKIDCACDV